MMMHQTPGSLWEIFVTLRLGTKGDLPHLANRNPGTAGSLSTHVTLLLDLGVKRLFSNSNGVTELSKNASGCIRWKTIGRNFRE